jgi:hypothetical protein
MSHMLARGHLEPPWQAVRQQDNGPRYVMTSAGWTFLEALGVLVQPSRQPVRCHSDSIEDGPHLSGAIGRALLSRFENLGGRKRQKSQRLLVTPKG